MEAIFDFREIRRRRDMILGLSPTGKVHGTSETCAEEPIARGRPLNWRMTQHMTAKYGKDTYDYFMGRQYLTTQMSEDMIRQVTFFNRCRSVNKSKAIASIFKYSTPQDPTTWCVPQVGQRVINKLLPPDCKYEVLAYDETLAQVQLRECHPGRGPSFRVGMELFQEAYTFDDGLRYTGCNWEAAGFKTDDEGRPITIGVDLSNGKDMSVMVERNSDGIVTSVKEYDTALYPGKIMAEYNRGSIIPENYTDACP